VNTKIGRILFGLLSVIAAVGLPPAPASAASTLTMLDTGGDVGQYPSLAIGADGLGLIAYLDETSGDLKVAHCSNVPCTAATISVIDAADVVEVGGVAIGSDGLGIVAYRTQTPSVFKTAHCSDLACTTATIRTVASSGGAKIAIAIGSDGLPLLAYESLARLRTRHCTVPDCASSTSADVGPAGGSQSVEIAIGAGGLPLIAIERQLEGPVDVRRCLDVACSSAAAGPPASGPFAFVAPASLVVPGDGRPLIGYRFSNAANPQVVEARMSRCTDATCAVQTPVFAFPQTLDRPGVALQPNGLPWFAYGDSPGRLHLRTCHDAGCTTSTETCANANLGFYISLARAADGRSLAAFYRITGGLGVVHDVSDACAAPQVNVADATVTEAPGAQASFAVALTAPSAEPVFVFYDTADGTATAGQDYTAAFGALTFPPGTTSVAVPVAVAADGVDEADESFSLDLSFPTGAALGDGHATGTIVDGDPTPHLVAGHCETVEGNTIFADCVISVSLVGASENIVRVDYQTVAGTATADVDYLPMSGQLVWFPGDDGLQEVLVPVLGDTDVELHETFGLSLSNPVNATIQDGAGEGTILDDDAPSLSSLELTHGSRLRADLAAQPGPTADQDLYRLAQPGPSSWEIVVDEVSGDVAPGLVLERLAEDNSTVLQTGVAVGSGSARALRWQRRQGFDETRQHIRVRSTGCSTECGADDAYRLRAYETTARIPRFNNSGTQGTVLLIQNATDAPVAANVDFWDPAGALLATAPLALGPRAVGVVNTLALAPLVGRSGSVSITHDGPYGALAGKAVALEPATGFSFDSPLAYQPR
jgi:Calx-beta domain-containing protein